VFADTSRATQLSDAAQQGTAASSVAAQDAATRESGHERLMHWQLELTRFMAFNSSSKLKRCKGGHTGNIRCCRLGIQQEATSSHCQDPVKKTVHSS